MLIHKGVKLDDEETEQRLGLRALLIHKGVKLGNVKVSCLDGLRALLIHKGVKLLALSNRISKV